jgi:hypothetical protein
LEIPLQNAPLVPIIYCPLVPIESDHHVLMTEKIIECSLERFLISTTWILFSDEKEKFRGIGVE